MTGAEFPSPIANRVDRITVEQSLPRERLDSFLRDRYGEVSRATIQRLIDEGHVRVNGEPVKPAHHPHAGEVIEIHWPEPKSAIALPQELALEILYEDSELLVLNKMAGMVVHPAVGHDDQTLVNALLHHCAGKLSGIGGVARPGIVHRLDKDTSGCLVVAKTDRAHTHLADEFAARKVEKVYHLIVCGELALSSGEIRAAIARHPSHRKRMAVRDGQGKMAWTSYRLLERLRRSSFVEALLHTGRTHQIRVHFHHLGYPLVGDDTYGSRQNQRLAEETGYRAARQMLHARVLSFTHPLTREVMRFEAPLPEDFRRALEMLRP